MFDFSSRYFDIPTATLLDAQGRELVYVRRRFLPLRDPAAQTLAEVLVTEADRLDLIATRTLGDPEQFWRICDANQAMHPAELTAEIGRRLIVLMP